MHVLNGEGGVPAKSDICGMCLGRCSLWDMAAAWVSSWHLEAARSLPLWALTVLEIKCEGFG